MTTAKFQKLDLGKIKKKSEESDTMKPQLQHVLCRICGDKASGLHYGVFACEGCKGFFRRTLKHDLQYKKCQNPKGCLIMRINRNRCQYCRMKKCFALGMSHDAVRLGRCPKKDRPSSSFMVHLPKTANGAVDTKRQIKLEQMILTIHKALRELPTSGIRLDESDKYHKTHEMLDGTTYIAHIVKIFDYVNRVTAFARGIPQFSSLNISDQHTLLKNGAMELSALIDFNEYRNAKEEGYDSNMIYSLTREIWSNKKVVEGLLEEFYSLARKLEKLKLTDVETALYMALILFCSDREGLEDAKVIEVIEIAIAMALKTQFSINHAESSNAFASVLYLIVDLRALSVKYWELILKAPVNTMDTKQAEEWEVGPEEEGRSNSQSFNKSDEVMELSNSVSPYSKIKEQIEDTILLGDRNSSSPKSSASDDTLLSNSSTGNIGHLEEYYKKRQPKPAQKRDSVDDAEGMSSFFSISNSSSPLSDDNDRPFDFSLKNKTVSDHPSSPYLPSYSPVTPITNKTNSRSFDYQNHHFNQSAASMAPLSLGLSPVQHEILYKTRLFAEHNRYMQLQYAFNGLQNTFPIYRGEYALPNMRRYFPHTSPQNR